LAFETTQVSLPAPAAATKLQVMLYPNNFLAGSDWPQLDSLNLATTESVVCARLKRGGLEHPSEMTVKMIASVVACCHYPTTLPDADAALGIVHEIKRLFRVNTGTAVPAEPLIEWPDMPSKLPASVWGRMYDPDDGPEPRYLPRMSVMMSHIPLRSTRKTLTKLPVITDQAQPTSSSPVSVGGVLQVLMQLVSAQGRLSTPGPMIQDITPDTLAHYGQAAARPSALAITAGAPPATPETSLPPSHSAGAHSSQPGAVSLPGHSAGNGGVALDPNAAAAATVDAVRAMELAAAGGDGGGPAMKGKKGKGKGAAMKTMAAGGGGGGLATGAKKGKEKKGAAMKKPTKAADPRKSKDYTAYKHGEFQKFMKRKMGMVEAHEAARKAADKKFKL